MQNLCIKNTKQLFNAIIRRDIEKIKECLKRDVNLAYQGQSKNNAFHLFFKHMPENTKILTMLIRCYKKASLCKNCVYKNVVSLLI